MSNGGARETLDSLSNLGNSAELTEDGRSMRPMGLLNSDRYRFRTCERAFERSLPDVSRRSREQPLARSKLERRARGSPRPIHHSRSLPDLGSFQPFAYFFWRNFATIEKRTVRKVGLFRPRLLILRGRSRAHIPGEKIYESRYQQILSRFVHLPFRDTRLTLVSEIILANM